MSGHVLGSCPVKQVEQFENFDKEVSMFAIHQQPRACLANHFPVLVKLNHFSLESLLKLGQMFTRKVVKSAG